MTGRKKGSGRVKALPEAWGIELHSERSGMFFYRYQRLRVERTGRRAAVREFVFQLEYGTDGELITKPRQLVRQRGRSLSVEECDVLWGDIAALRPDRLVDSYLCLDDTSPEDLDDSRTPEGLPIAVLTGEEGPACLSIRQGRARDAAPRRIVIERFAGPSPLVTRKAPLASIVALLDPGLRDVAPLTYRRSRVLEDLIATFEDLKALDFLNLREFERRCLEALGWLGDGRALPFLTSELFAPDPSVRLSALNALAKIGEESASGDVELLYYDDDPGVRERAREVLDELAGVAR